MTVPLAPRVLTGTTLFAVLLTAQFLLGASQGPIFPVSSGVFEAWFRRSHWALAQGLQSMRRSLGAAVHRRWSPGSCPRSAGSARSSGRRCRPSC